MNFFLASTVQDNCPTDLLSVHCAIGGLPFHDTATEIACNLLTFSMKRDIQ